MIDFLLGMLLLTSLVSLGLFSFKPSLFNEWFKLNLSRKKIVISLLGVLFSVFLLIGLFGEPVDDTSNLNQGNEDVVEVNKINDQQLVEQQGKTAKIISVIDGDTVEVEIDGDLHKVRLIGIDTPETKHPSKPVECFGHEASKFLTDLVGGKSVRLQSDSSQDDQDKYDRLLRYIFLDDGTNINLKMVSDGYAYEYTYQTPYQYQSEFKDAENNARKQSKGLWSEGTCDGERVIPTEQSNSNSSQNNNSTGSPQTGANCDPNYSPCVPKYPPDLDCGDIGHPVAVIGSSDPHGFDRDGDGAGCESY